MTLATVLTFSRAQAQTDSNGLTDTNGIIYANEALQDFHRKLVNAGVDASQTQEAYVNGVIPSTAGNGSTFAYPSDMLFLKAIEVNFSDTSAQNYRTAAQVDVSNLPRGSFSELRVNANRNTPLFDDRGDWFEIFPAFTSSDNLTNAIRIFYFLQPTQYTTTGDTVSYPESLDTTILGWRIAADYLYSLNNTAQGDAFNMKYEERVRQYIATLSRGVQTPTQATPIQISGFEF